MSDDLIARLSSDLRPVPQGTLRIRLLAGLAIGAAIATVLMIAWLGLRPDLAAAAMTPIFWAKFSFTLVLSALGLVAMERLSRPGGRLRMPIAGVAAVIALTGAAGIVQILLSPSAEVRTLVIGGSALVCPFYIVGLSVPVLAASLWVMRRLAPTNLPAAGFAAGLVSGSLAAWVYAFHCTESGLPFITIWYTLGIIASALIGMIAGRWLLRW